MLRVFISGQKYFGEQVFDLCRKMEGVEIVGVAAPVGDRYIGRAAITWGVPIITSGTLSGDTMPDNVDLGITAHSFDYIGRKTRFKPLYGWIGYHPSLLPRHRGRSSIEWAVKMREPVTGGTVFWLNSGIDRGDIAYQDFCFIDPKLFNEDSKKAAASLWRNSLQEMGVRLLSKAISDIMNGVIIRSPQDKRFSTWEPSTEVKDIYRPDSLMLEQNNRADGWYKKNNKNERK